MRRYAVSMLQRVRVMGTATLGFLPAWVWIWPNELRLWDKIGITIGCLLGILLLLRWDIDT